MAGTFWWNENSLAIASNASTLLRRAYSNTPRSMRDAVVHPSDMLMTRAPWSTAKIAPFATPALEHT